MTLTRHFDVHVNKPVAVTLCPRRVFWETARASFWETARASFWETARASFWETARASFARKQQKFTPTMAKPKLAVTDTINYLHRVYFWAEF
jgi:hypothetical protein